jgi:hypothetical protein
MNLLKKMFKSPLMITMIILMALAACAQTKKAAMTPYDYEKAGMRSEILRTKDYRNRH